MIVGLRRLHRLRWGLGLDLRYNNRRRPCIAVVVAVVAIVDVVVVIDVVLAPIDIGVRIPWTIMRIAYDTSLLGVGMGICRDAGHNTC